MMPHAALFCIGHSHVASLRDAALNQGACLHSINFWEAPGSLLRDADGRWLLSDSTISAVQSHDGPIFSLIGGASYGVLGMLCHPRRWDFVLPQARALPLDPRAELIAYGAVRETLSALMAEYLDIVAQLARVAGARLHHIEPPPPHADAERITPHIPWPLYPGMLHEVAPASLRYKLWRLQSDLLREHAGLHHIGFIDHPDGSADEHGFMRDEYFLDGAHANPDYGALVLAQMRRIHAASI